MRPVVILFGVLLTLALASVDVNACSCAGPGPPCESFGSADAVFAGTVVSVRENKRTSQPERGNVDWHPVAFKFSVEHPYLGVTGAEIEVFTGQGGGDCGYQFKVGRRYLVYAYRYENKLSTGICTRTKPFETGSEDLAFLGTLSSTPSGVTIYGSVSNPNAKDEPLPAQLKLTIEGETGRKDIRLDEKGRFRLSGLPAGKYKVKLDLPETLTAWQPEREITVSDRGCAAVGWHLTDNGRVSGRIVDGQGEPAAKIMVSLIAPGANPKENQIKLERADENGRFSFSEVPRGSYQIAINHYRFPDPNDPTTAYPPSFYPGVVDQAQAKTIVVGPGEKLSDLEILIPSRRSASVLEGTVVWAEGSPVEYAQLTVTDMSQGEHTIGHSIKADAQGKFRINGYVGQTLVIDARSNRQYVAGTGNRFDPMERSEKVRLTLERPTQNLRIVITKLR